MNEHIFFESPERSGAFIMQFAPPFCYGQIYKFKTAESLHDFVAKAIAQHEVKAGELIFGYNICIVHRGSLLPHNPGTHEPLETIYRHMCDYYHQHKILNHENYYKKFRAEP